MIERRGSPRVTKKLPVRIKHADSQLIAHTKDISASGAYCVLRRYVPPMTKLRVRVELGGRPKRELDCEGVVVRVEPAKPDARRRTYHVAIFFHDLTEHNRAVLSAYIQSHLEPAIRRR